MLCTRLRTEGTVNYAIGCRTTSARFLFSAGLQVWPSMSCGLEGTFTDVMKDTCIEKVGAQLFKGELGLDPAATIPDARGQSPIDLALKAGYTDLAEVLQSRRDQLGCTDGAGSAACT
mmetsp:Transcript_55410/g.179744  ORF Transcript_55410/g.179744 Transcript_55410/m.179744 type:complete len:118 (+) Transcript_55410:461-814(+)